MLFHSPVFLFAFLPVQLALWHGLRGSPRARLAALTAGSYVFYGAADWRFCGLLAFSTTVDYLIGARLHASDDRRTQRAWLTLSVATNLGLLATFKYAGMAAHTLNTLAGSAWVAVPAVTLPPGISFYTFQSLSYTVDLYRGRVRPVDSLLTFACFVAMFPQLVAGPILRFKDLDDQLAALPQRLGWVAIQRGVQLFVVGLAKKLLVADTLAVAATPCLARPADLSLAAAWFGVLGYSMQLYFDFSGYSDMAVGLGQMLGFRYPQNFDSPYKATSITDFWRRWHITLSTFLRDYLYIPLGGNRAGVRRQAANMLVTMALGGLWHGAAWTFVAWGLLHGLYLGAARLWSRRGTPLPAPLAQALTFLAVVWAWVPFRAPSFPAAGQTWAAMVGLGTVPTDFGALGLRLPATVTLACALAFLAPNSEQLPPGRTAAAGVALGLVFVVCLLSMQAPSPFLYYRF